ncbi:MAG: helix-turn-helix domain-containing protein [Thermoproteota archaeon]
MSILGRKKREEELERELIELRERCSLLERRLEEAVEKTARVEKGARLLTEAVYKIIAYLKDLEWPREEKAPKPEAKPVTVTMEKPVKEEAFNETESKLLEEIDRRGALTVVDCYENVGRSKEHVSRTLKQLVDKGVLTRERKGKIFYYRRAEK